MLVHCYFGFQLRYLFYASQTAHKLLHYQSRLFCDCRRAGSLTPIKRSPLQTRQDTLSAKRMRMAHSAKKQADPESENCHQNSAGKWGSCPQQWLITDSNRAGAKDDIDTLAQRSGVANNNLGQNNCNLKIGCCSLDVSV